MALTIFLYGYLLFLIVFIVYLIRQYRKSSKQEAEIKERLDNVKRCLDRLEEIYKQDALDKTRKAKNDYITFDLQRRSR